MKNLISSVFSHEIKNSLSSIRFGIEMFDKYEMDKDEKKKFISDLLNTIDNTMKILDEYINFIKFQFVKVKYEKINLYSILEEIKTEITPFAEKKGVNIYIQKKDVFIISPKFWIKRAIYNIVYNAVKYNKRSGSVNIKIEPSIFGVYLSIQDTGIGIERKKLKSIFKFFERIDETQKGFGIGLALSKSVIENIGGKITVKSNENIGSDFILYIPNKPKEMTIKKIAKGIVASSVVLFFTVSYFPIYSQNYEKNINGGFISYNLEDGSVLKFSDNAKYEISLKKSLYGKYKVDTNLYSGLMSLKAIKAKADIEVGNNNFQNLGTDFEISKDKNIKVAVFDGKVKGANNEISKKEGLIVGDVIKKVTLLDKVENLRIQNNILKFKDNKKAIKYRILISKDEKFSKIENQFFTTKTKTKIYLDNDTLYYIKVFAYDENELPSMPNVISFVNLTHYYKALKLEKYNIEEAFLELQNSISTIKNYSSLPYFEIAKLYFKQKNYKKSIFYIKKAISIKKDIKYYKLLADNYIITKDYKQLKDIIDLLLKKYPKDIDLLYYKAVILKNNPKEAQKILFKLLEINPHHKKANELMAEIMDKLGKKELAKYYRGLE